MLRVTGKIENMQSSYLFFLNTIDEIIPAIISNLEHGAQAKLEHAHAY